MKKVKITFWISTGLITLLTLMSAGMYLFNTAEVAATFEKLGYPTYLIIPLAFIKLAGIATIWFVKNQSLKEWAYAGFFFDFVLAFAAHLAVADGEFAPALVACVLLLVSYFSGNKLRAAEAGA